MKRLGVVLALLIVFGTLAVGMGIVKAETTEWFAEVPVAADTLNSMLNSTTWVAYTPNVTQIVAVNDSASRVYFATEKDLVRFLLPTDLKQNFLINASKVKTPYQYTLIQYELKDINDNSYHEVYTAEFYDGSVFYAIHTYYTNDIYNKVRVTTSSGTEEYQNKNINVFGEALPTQVKIEYLDDGVDYYEKYAFIVYRSVMNVSLTENSAYIVSRTVYNTIPAEFKVFLELKDALTGQSLNGVTVKEGDTVLGTLDDGGSIELAIGTHTLTFEKSGYWSVTKTIDVQGDTTVSVEMYPSSAAFKLENFPSDITIPENTIYELTFTLSPIDTSATYNTYLSISGLSDVLEVRKDGSIISEENGKYYLGDISSATQVSIKFKAGTVGTHGFTLTLTSNDAIMSQTYTTTKQVTYTVEPLPFSVQMPSEWQVGTNELRISESSGQSYLITAVLKDSSGNEVWSDSYAFSPYEAHTFSINVPSEGSYTLELQFNGQTAVYDITVNPAISLKTKTLTVQEGGEGTIVLHFKNPSSSVQYYTIKVSGGFLPAEINQSISVAPLSEKDVSIAFAVPEDLTYDAYELQVQVLQGDSVVFSDKVAVSISDDGGFSLFGGGSGGNTWLYVGLGILLLGGVIWALRRR